MLVVGDKIEQVKPMSGFNKVGEMFTVENVSSVGVITIATTYGIGVMSYDEFEMYFKKVEQKDRKYKWTIWEPVFDEDEDSWIPSEYEYRTNAKRVVVRLRLEGSDSYLAASASCHEIDEFNLNKGINIAKARLEFKLAKRKLESILKEYK